MQHHQILHLSIYSRVSSVTSLSQSVSCVLKTHFWFYYYVLQFHFIFKVFDQKDGRTLPLQAKCPNTEFFLVHVFPHIDWIQRFTEQMFLISSNTAKYGPEKTAYLDTSRAVPTFTIVKTLLPKYITIIIFWRFDDWYDNDDSIFIIIFYFTDKKQSTRWSSVLWKRYS